MRLISAGSLVRIQSGPPLKNNFAEMKAGGSKSLTERVSVMFFDNYIQIIIRANYNSLSSIVLRKQVMVNFVIKLLSANGECLGAKRR